MKNKHFGIRMSNNNVNHFKVQTIFSVIIAEMLCKVYFSENIGPGV